MNPSDLRPIQAAEDAVEGVRQAAKGALISWLDHFECRECGAICEANRQYVERQAMICEVWSCPECDAQFHRDEGNPLRAEMWSDK